MKGIAEKHGKSVAQIILRWDVQHGVVTIPKSTKEQRIIENAALFDFELTEDDMNQIDGLNEDRRVGPDPDNFDF
ncbi:putative oxidoreductase YtbE [compost metagenome]